MQVIVGGDPETDLPAYTRCTSKSAYEQNMLINFDVFEIQLNYIIKQLQVTSPFSVVITESIATLDACRKNTDELLHKKYACQKLTYGIDSVFGLYDNALPSNKYALIVSIGFKTTHVIPFVDGIAIKEKSKRYARAPLS